MNHTMTANDSTQNPAEIEQDIRRTQANMSRTVNKIGDQFTARSIFNALLDKADENNVDARMLIEGARRNPVALGLIAAGAIWLVSDKDSKFPSFGSGKSDGSGNQDSDHFDVHHRDYVSHMSEVQIREGEDPLIYQHRRDIARANFLMIEPSHDEDEHGFRKRLDDMTEKFRDTRRAWADTSGRVGSATKEKASKVAEKVQDLYERNPLVGGILAAALGAALGSGIPISRKEEEKLGNLGEKARDLASEKKDEMVQKADRKVQQQPAKTQPTDQSHPQRRAEHSRS